MGLLRYDAPLNVLLFTKGHPFQRDAFHAVFDGMGDIAVTAVEHPAAEAFYSPDTAAPFDTIVCYDMPGIQFRPGKPPVFHEPPAAVIEGFEALLAAGKGFVFLHHALAGWPTWERYAEVMGGRFLYEPAKVGGVDRPDSGYHHAVTHRVTAADPAHPITDGIGDGFEITDELYLAEIFEDRVTPVLRSDAKFEADAFYSASRALRGELFSNEGWEHPSGSDLVAWTREEGASRIATFLAGDGPVAYENPAFRRILENAIRWTARTV